MSVKRETDSVSPDRNRSSEVKRPRSGPKEAPIKLLATEPDLAERATNPRDHWSYTQCWTLRELLGLEETNDYPARAIKFLVLGSYMIDFEYLLDAVPELVGLANVVVFFGIAETSPSQWKSMRPDSLHLVQLDPSDAPGPHNPTNHRIPYGVHHSKFFLVGLSDGSLRVVVLTSNLRYADVSLKAQGAYIQDFRPKRDDSSGTSPFEETLVRYLATYRYDSEHDWRGTGVPEFLSYHIRRYDFSTALVDLVPSTPGYHRLDDDHQCGHWRLRNLLSTRKQTRAGPIICQFSSIGSLTEKYLQELQTSMSVIPTESEDLKLQLIYPTVHEIRQSLEGYVGGVSVPGSTRNTRKPFLQKLYKRWSSSISTNPIWKSDHVPHIKTYYQIAASGESMEWFVLTSHNLSKAAWGEIKTLPRLHGRRLFVRHWELGVMMTPSGLGCERLVPWSTMEHGVSCATVPLPFRLFPEPYRKDDSPWTVDSVHTEPDRFGRRSLDDDSR